MILIDSLVYAGSNMNLILDTGSPWVNYGTMLKVGNMSGFEVNFSVCTEGGATPS